MRKLLAILALATVGCSTNVHFVLTERNEQKFLAARYKEKCLDVPVAPKGCGAWGMSIQRFATLANEGQAAVDAKGDFPLLRKAIKQAKKAAVKARPK